jgi:hypothetical protein
MHDSDLADFERAFAKLCAGFDTPPTQVRKDAYWQGFRFLHLADFVAAVDRALALSTEDEMPSVPKLRRLAQTGAVQLPPRSGGTGPTIQEQLCEYVMLTRFPINRDARFTQEQGRQVAQPWTYLYREWTEDKRRCAECTGVMVPAFGTRAGFHVTVADMLADPLHAQVMRYFSEVPAKLELVG